MTHEQFTRGTHHGKRDHELNLVSLAALLLALIGVVFAILSVAISGTNPLVVVLPAVLAVVAILRLRS